MNPDKIYLVQTDTTAGFLSQNRNKLNKIKNRPENTPVLREVESLAVLKHFTRVPKKFKNRVRRSEKTTFIFPNSESFRVVKNERHLSFLRKFQWMYSTSANMHKEKFNKKWAEEKADVTVEDKNGLFESRASSIYKISRSRIRKIR